MAKDSPAEVKSAHEWLNQASETLGISPEVTRELVGDLLDLTRDVAHGPSRPAAPVTAFLVGLSAGRGLEAGAGDEKTVEQVRAAIKSVNAKLEEHTK